METNWQDFWEKYPPLQKDNPGLTNVRDPKFNFAEQLKHVDKTLKFEKDDEVLDVGCGTGETVALLRPKVKIAIGVDYSLAMHKIARERHQKDVFFRMAAHNLAYIDERFDKVICLGVINHIPRDLFEPSIREMLRVLKSGGKLYIGDVLEEAEKDAQVFTYPLSDWKILGPVDVAPSYFKQGKRIDIIITKK